MERKALGAQDPTCSTADVKEDSVPSSLAELPDCLVQNFCPSRVDLEEGVWRDAEPEAQQLLEDVRGSVQELVRGLLVGAACHGAARAHKKQLSEGSREELLSIPRVLMGSRGWFFPSSTYISCEPFKKIKAF